MLYTYNSQRQITLDTNLSWDTTKKIWTAITSNTYTYDGNGDRILVITKTQDTASSQFLNTLKITDSLSGNTKVETVYSWDTAYWLPLFKEIFYLDKNSNDTLMQHQNWDNGAWVNAYQYQKTFNSNKKLLTLLTSQWDSSKWTLTDKESYEYDANGYDTLYIHQNMDTNKTWQYVFMQQATNTYNASNALTLRVENGSYDNKVFDPFVRKYFYPDANQNDTLQVNQLWDAGSSKFVNEGRITTKYQVFTKMKETLVACNCMKVYPNPVTGSSFFVKTNKASDVKLYNLSGKLILTQLLSQESYDTEIQIPLLLSGVYILEVKDERGVVRNKLVVN